METASITRSPRRITDLVNAKAAGALVQLKTAFEILPVDFQHRLNPFQAYIFLAKYSGTVDATAFAFRKCYARGCPNNLCPHVSLAVKVANRYLQRDYHTLKQSGIAVEETLFKLDEMMVKFDHIAEEDPPPLTVLELSAMARAGKVMGLEIELEMIPAVEHFAGVKNRQTFLSGEFTAETNEGRIHCHRCFACFATDEQEEEKKIAVMVANSRLKVIYDEFGQLGVKFQPQYFS